MNWVSEVKKRAELGKPPVSGGRSVKLDKFSFDDLVFVPSQLAKRPYDYFRDKIETETIIGKMSRKPLKLKTPIMAAAMSFGALSKEAKIIIAKAMSEVGSTANTGEGGMLPEERKFSKLLIAQYSTARFGVDGKYINSADAIEFKIGQGAKPGQGGLLPKEKITKDIMKVRKLKKAEDLHSPPAHPNIHSIADLRKKVMSLRRLTDGKPIILKLGAGDVEADVKLALKANPDVIAIDGHAGGTGAAPDIMLNDFGTPTLPALVKARKVMDKKRAKQELIIGGGLNTGADMAKALALGADAVFLGMPLLVAMGCIYCKVCYKGKCPVGITTQDPALRKKLIIDKGVVGVLNYITACTEEIKMAAAACGHNNVHELNRNDILSLSSEITQSTGIKLV